MYVIKDIIMWATCRIFVLNLSLKLRKNTKKNIDMISSLILSNFEVKLKGMILKILVKRFFQKTRQISRVIE